MARQGKTAEAAPSVNGQARRDSAPPAVAAPASAFEFAPFGLEALRGAIGRSLGSAQVAAAWMEEFQRANTQLATAWVETLALGVREAESAEDAMQLLAVPVRMLSRQLEIAWHRAGDGVQQMMQGEQRWFEPFAQAAAGAASGAGGPGGPGGPGGSGGGNAEPLDPATVTAQVWQQGLERWRSMAREWTDAFEAATHR